jgi:hypothetical protein
MKAASLALESATDATSLMKLSHNGVFDQCSARNYKNNEKEGQR